MSDACRSAAPSRCVTAAVAVLLTTALTACGDVDSADPSPTPSESVRSSSSEQPSKAASEAPAPSEDDSEPAAPVLEVEVEGDVVRPVAEQVELAVGQPLTIIVESDRAGQLHVHADAEQTFPFGSGMQGFKLVVDTPGAVDIEEHGAQALVARALVR